jgi:acyl-coenzyme A thioesterase PaaI-like protein
MPEKHDPKCYGCSHNNPIGLKVDFRIKDGAVYGEFQSNPDHTGPPKTVHGGIIAALIDEALAYVTIHLLKQDTRTVKEEFTFRNAAKTGDKLLVEARLKEEKSRAYIVSARVLSGDTIIAEGTGMLFKI